MKLVSKLVVTKSLRELISDFLTNTTIHALPNVVRNKNIIIKAIWLILFLLSLSGFLYSFISKTAEYLNYEVNTNVVVYRESPTNFPVVTFCNFNAYNTPEIIGIAEFLIKFRSDSTLYNDTTRELINLQNFYLETQLAYYLNASMRQEYTLNLTQMLLSCYYQRKKCNPDDFEYFLDPKFGNCYKFNAGKMSDGSKAPIRQANSPGYLNGLKMELYLGDVFLENRFSTSTGVYLAVHNQSYQPLIPDEGILLPSGMSNSVAVERIFYKKLSKPYSDCVDENESFNSELYMVTKSIGKYTQKYCYKFCFQKLVISECKCSSIQYSKLNINNARACLSVAELFCVLDAEKKFYSNDYIKKNCEPFCPKECESIDYKLNIFGTNYPNYGYAAYVINDKKSPVYNPHFDVNDTSFYSIIQKAVIEVNVFYESETYTEILDVKKIDGVDYLSELGGQIGVFLGMSFLSFVEIIDLIVKLIIKLISRCLGRSN